MNFRAVIISFLLVVCSANATSKQVVFLHDYGGVQNSNTPEITIHNTLVFTRVLQQHGNNTILQIPQNHTYYLANGVYGTHLNNFTLEINGSLEFVRNYKHAVPLNSTWEHLPKPCIYLEHCYNVTMTSSSYHQRNVQDQGGIVNGGGPAWWGIPFLGYLQLQEHRPILVAVNHTSQITIEHLLFMDAPFYTLKLVNVQNVVMRHASIVARRTPSTSGHSLLDLSAFNTDGIDVAGHNVHVHDVDIWNQDDCIAVKDNFDDADQRSSNMLFERITASGLGLVIGSIGYTAVSNITFRDSILYETYKGIYLKFRKPHCNEPPTTRSGGLIENVVFQNISMVRPKQWPIWIGPSQQTGGRRNPCAAEPCSLCWPKIPTATCSVDPQSVYRNVTLNNIEIQNPAISPGVILGGMDNVQMHDVIFDCVRVTRTDKDAKTYQPDMLFPGLAKVNAHRVDALVRKGRDLVVVVLVVLTLALGLLVVSWWALESYTQYRHEPLPQEEEDSEDDDLLIGVEDNIEQETNRQDAETRRETNSWILLIVTFGTTILASACAYAILFSPNVVLIMTILLSLGVLGICLGIYLVLQKRRRRQDRVDISMLRNEHKYPVLYTRCSLCMSCTRQQQQEPPETVRIWISGIVILVKILLVGMVGYTCLRFLWVSSRTSDITSYYLCDGVQGGIARGETWPVPMCFRDETDRTEAHRLSDSKGSLGMIIGLSAMIVGSVMAACWCYVCALVKLVKSRN